MPVLTPAEFTTLQSQHPLAAKVKWYMALAPYGDPTFTALVNDAGIAKGERDITYDTDVGELNVIAGMTLWVGTGAGLYDIGKVRIRSIDTVGNVVTVAENDDIQWADALHLTCPGEAGFRELWGVYPRITEVGGVVTFYEDYDLLFSANPDDIIPPKANAGPPICAFLNDDGWVDISFAEDGESFTTEIAPAAIASYLWDFSDGVVQVGNVNQAGTCAVPNVVRFNSTGFRYVSLTVTDSTARTRTGVVYVPVWIFDRTSAPPLSVEVLDRTGDPHWQMRVKAFATDAAAQDVFYNYPNGALCVVFTETEYPDASSNIGGVCHRSNIEFVGWLDAETLNFAYDAGTVEFTVIGHDLRLAQLPGFAYTIEDGIPTDWLYVDDLDLDRSLHVHLERKTTVNQVCHVERLGEGAARPIAIQPFPDASPYAHAQDHLLKDAMSNLLADRQGIFRVRRDPQFMNNIARNLVDVVCTLTAQDILNAVDESKPHQLELGYVRLGGFSYETPLLAQAPGVAPGQSEAATHTEGFIVINQLELNLWAGLWYKKENNPYKTIPVELSGYWPVFDPAMQEYVRLTLTDPLGRNPLTNQRFIVRQVTFRDSAVDGTTTTELILEMETVILYGEFVEVVIPPPPEPPPPPPEVIIIPVPPPDFALVHDRAEIYTTPDFQLATPVWTNVTGPILGVIFCVECDYYDGKGAWALTGTSGTDANDLGAGVGLWRTDDVTIGAPIWNLMFSQQDGDTNRKIYEDCFTGGAEPTWGQLRSLYPIASGKVIIAEARWHGLTGNLRDSTMMYRVDRLGAFIDAYREVYPPNICDCNASEVWWCVACGLCGSDSAHNQDARFFQTCHYVNQGEFRGCHQLAYMWGEVLACGMKLQTDTSNYCNSPAACGVSCISKRLLPVNPDAGLQEYLDGCTHMINHKGAWLGQSQKKVGGGGTGELYSGNLGSIDEPLWSNFGFCNICSHPEYYYYCKADAIDAFVNNLLRDGIDIGISSDLLFGANGPGFDAGRIGHIRAIWDVDRTIVIVRKEEPDALQPNKEVVYIWDATNGLRNRTGNLTGLWEGTGDELPPIASNYRWDNVGFSAFGVPLR